MRKWRYTTQDELGKPLLITVTDDDIIRDYFPYWHKRMKEKDLCKGMSIEQLHKLCICDFCVVNWAWEINRGNN